MSPDSVWNKELLFNRILDLDSNHMFDSAPGRLEAGDSRPADCIMASAPAAFEHRGPRWGHGLNGTNQSAAFQRAVGQNHPHVLLT